MPKLKIRHHLISKHRPYLLREIDAKYLMDYFVETGQFGEDDVERLTGILTTKRRNAKFLDLVKAKDPELRTFISSLHKENFSHVIEKLTGTCYLYYLFYVPITENLINILHRYSLNRLGPVQ